MKQHKQTNEELPEVLRRVNRRSGLEAPEGYFDDFAERMAAKLPVMEWEKGEGERAPEPPRSLWQRVRPYVYLAAMFAGIWCMLQIFTLTGPAGPADLTISSRPELAHALTDRSFTDEYLYDTDFSQSQDDLMDSLWEAGFDPTATGI